ncbi:GPP34 family phosphoprotein [Actinoplanes sp. NPDC049548]|uniref:GOLPH3/VPS74 family protein n=1 Tax=Actinoplanes sp. NPDC049548 TaxID=3155152 RepID=UPI00342BD960
MIYDLPSVRDQLWLLAHDETRDLRPRLDVRALSVGLTGATVVDLLLQNRVHLQAGRLRLHGYHPSPVADPIAASILLTVRDQHEPRLADVLRNPTHLYDRTVAALIAAGTLVEHRRILRGSRYRLAEDALATWVRSQFTRRLYRSDIRDGALDALCALVWALNLHSALLLPYSTAEADDILRTITEQIPVRAGTVSHLAVIPHLAGLVRHAIGDLATAPF